MKEFRYEAAEIGGAICRGRLAARDEAEAAQSLMVRGLYLLRLEPPATPLFRRRPSKVELGFLFRSLASLAEAAVPIDRALEVVRSQVPPRIQSVLDTVRASVAGGASLSEALGAAPDVFPAAIVGIVAAGEQGSRLTAGLEHAALLLEHDAELSGRIRQTLAYPVILAVVGTGSIATILGFVLPRFAELLDGAGVELPASTRFLLSTGTVVRQSLPVVGLVAVIVGIAAARLCRRADVRRRLHAAALRLPLVGGVRLLASSGRLCRTLGGLIEAGVPILVALELSGAAMGDDELAVRLQRARDRIARGEPIAMAFDRERVLAPGAQQLVALGESTGRLAPMVLRAGHTASAAAERRVRSLVSLLEPTLVLIFAAAVAFVAAAMLQAVYSMRPGV